MLSVVDSFVVILSVLKEVDISLLEFQYISSNVCMLVGYLLHVRCSNNIGVSCSMYVVV